MASLFEMELVLGMIKTILETNQNHCDYEYLSNLAQELQQKIDENTTCGSCKKSCGNKHCPVAHLRSKNVKG